MITVSMNMWKFTWILLGFGLVDIVSSHDMSVSWEIIFTKERMLNSYRLFIFVVDIPLLKKLLFVLQFNCVVLDVFEDVADLKLFWVWWLLYVYKGFVELFYLWCFVEFLDVMIIFSKEILFVFDICIKFLFAKVKFNKHFIYLCSTYLNYSSLAGMNSSWIFTFFIVKKDTFFTK